MKKQGAETNNVIKRPIKIIFQRTEDFLKLNFKQEHTIKSITF